MKTIERRLKFLSRLEDQNQRSVSQLSFAEPVKPKRMLFKQRSKSTDDLQIEVHENFIDLKPVYDEL